ncbi:hypothetical protein B0G81_1346 [Paraburkholderia sp. BL6665CI2N2]|nr:hypothetical protein B0G81_1346 [Paraburkholderia sp. BL6665CI2N2]
MERLRATLCDLAVCLVWQGFGGMVRREIERSGLGKVLARMKVN